MCEYYTNHSSLDSPINKERNNTKSAKSQPYQPIYKEYENKDYKAWDKQKQNPLRVPDYKYPEVVDRDWKATDRVRRSSTQESVAYVPRTAPKKRPDGIQVVQGHLNGVKTYAIPDTGAQFNIMAESYAKREGLSIDSSDPSKSRFLQMASGKLIKTIGTVDATWGFASDSSQNWKITFHILADFVYDLILGSQFLFTTKTMSHHKERLSRIPHPLGSLSVLCVNSLGFGSQQVKGHLQQEQVNALPDSGSEPNLLSYEYAQRRGWLKKMNMEDQNLLQFADGSIERTEGSISARWVPSSVKSKQEQVGLEAKFHVLRGCSHDVILGQDVLEETDMFFEHADSFFEVESDTEATGLNLVIWLPKKKKITLTEGPASNKNPSRSKLVGRDDALHNELERRAAVDREISKMPEGLEKESHLEREIATRRKFDTLMENLPSSQRTFVSDNNSNNRVPQPPKKIDKPRLKTKLFPSRSVPIH